MKAEKAEVLAKFVRDLLTKVAHEEGGEIDCEEIQDEAVSCGIFEEFTITQEDLDEMDGLGDLEVGDVSLRFPSWLMPPKD